MAQFQLLKGNKPIGGKFDSDVNPFDTKACVDLLKRQAIGQKVPVESAVLLAYERGRKVRTYRAT